MFKIESYITPILLSYVDKYVRDFKPADAQVSLWGGGVALHNLVLKADVLQQEVALPFTLVSGRIHELLIQVPWTKIMSEPIIVTIDTIECVLSLNPPAPPDETLPPEPPRRSQVVEAPPGYMQALVRRIVSNIALRVHHLIVKYVHDDIVLSLNVKHLAVDSAGPTWQPAFADIDTSEPVIRRLVKLDDLTLCLDRADSDGKIRFYQEPLLYRCQLDLRVLTRLVSANTRRASNLSVQLRSSKLAWGVTNEQLVLLLRLLSERPEVELKPATPAPKTSNASLQAPLNVTSSNSAEPARQESWSEWAWSWLPAWSDDEGAVQEPSTPAAPIPIHLAAYLDHVALVFKMLEVEASGRRRARGLLELSTRHAAARCSVRAPAVLRARLALRTITLAAKGGCVCAHDALSTFQERNIYLSSMQAEATNPWTWPEETLGDYKVEVPRPAGAERDVPFDAFDSVTKSANKSESNETKPESPDSESALEVDPLWQKMAPVLFVEFCHERSPPQPYTNPYENPPDNFQYSDWVELCTIRVHVAPLELIVSASLLHRLNAVQQTLATCLPPPAPEAPTRILTIEECDALLENIPQRRITIDTKELRVRLVPWDYCSQERPAEPPILLDLEINNSLFVITGPLYSHRVCSAACQLPEDSGPLWHGARLHVSGSVRGAQAAVRAPGDAQPRPCARADLRLVAHVLLHQRLFQARESVLVSYSGNTREMNVCGSAARLEAAVAVIHALLNERSSILRRSNLARDALNDEEAVALELTLEDLSFRGYVTRNINTHIFSLQSARATAYHAPKGGELKQAWVFSAPDTPTTTPYLRTAVQWCTVPAPNSFDYIGMWTEPTAFCADPLLIAWLGYKPTVKPSESQTQLHARTSSNQLFLRRRTPPSSASRLTFKSASGAELVHMKPKSGGSSSEPSERREEVKQPQAQSKAQLPWWRGDRLVSLHARLSQMLVNVELGLALIYVTSASASALDCATVRDAMERHAWHVEPVLVLSMGRFSVQSNSNKKHLWQHIRHDGPTFIASDPDPTSSEDADSFPWKMRLADVSCYTLEGYVPFERSSRDNSTLRSQLKAPPPGTATPKTVLELVTTSVTLSVVTKNIHIKTNVTKHSKKQTQSDKDERTKYFTTGMNFKPSTLKEFFRGPVRRLKQDEEDLPSAPSMTSNQVREGPVVSLGMHLHADTPPIIVRIDHEQVQLVASALHGLQHVLTLLQRTPPAKTYAPTGGSQHSLARSVSEMEEMTSPSDDTRSENQDDLVPIFESQAIAERVLKMKTFFWFQWVVSRATLVVATTSVKLAIDIDDIITTVDLQAHYNQLKIKIASASVRHYDRDSNDDWKAGVLGGRVLEAREATSAMQENQFLGITITQAQLSNLPDNWKEELHPKLLEQKLGVDTMWEIYATLAPLEAVIRPTIVENVVSLLDEFAPRSFCPLQTKVEERDNSWQWPFCYVDAGGLRLLVTTDDEETDKDDTFIIVIGKLTVNPHPDNPICRRAINMGTENWVGGGPFEGRQYEVLISNFAVRTAQLAQIVFQEVSEKEMMKGTGGENPAVKWSQPTVSPTITPLLHAVDVGCVLAPAAFTGGLLACGPAVELNLVSDCALELTIEQVGLIMRVSKDFMLAIHNRAEQSNDEEKRHACPYATLLMSQTRLEEDIFIDTETILVDERIKMSSGELGFGGGADSGVDTGSTSYSTMKSTSRIDDPPKKSVSIAFAEQVTDASEFLEVFVTMGVIDLSLHVTDDGSTEMDVLRPPGPASRTDQSKVVFEETPSSSPQQQRKEDTQATSSRTKSITDHVRSTDIGKTKLLTSDSPGKQDKIPLVHVTLHQPNLYYWRRKASKNLQVSLFDAWVGLGAGHSTTAGQWHTPLMSTARGAPDPVTDIPPALATFKLSTPGASGNTKGTVNIDIERPVQFHVSTNRLLRLQCIMELINQQMPPKENDTSNVTLPALYKMRRLLVSQGVESATIQTGQVSVVGCEGAAGVGAVCVQVAGGARPERASVRALLTALLVSAGPPHDARRTLLRPLVLGIDLEASWEAWRRMEGASAYDPTIRLGLDVDRVICDLQPSDLAAFARLRDALETLMPPQPPQPSASMSAQSDSMSATFNPRVSRFSAIDLEVGNHYYKDDLRSGAFKIVSGGQLPMAYQVTLSEQAVAWRYPHPRAITRVVAFPLPGQTEEIECVLEFYSPMLQRWHAHTYFKLPLEEPRELQLYVAPPDTVFAQMWRYRACLPREQPDGKFEFNVNRFLPRRDPLMFETQPEVEAAGRGKAPVSSEQLSGVVRVDSYLCPRALPRVRLAARLTEFTLFLHNAPPAVASTSTSLEGYYVSRPLMRSHQVLTLSFTDATAYAHLGSPAGYKLMVAGTLSSDVLDCGTGMMVEMLDQFRVQCALSVPDGEQARARLRACAAPARLALHVPRLRTLQALAKDWTDAMIQHVRESKLEPTPQELISKRPSVEETIAALDGRVSIWIHNTCASAIRIGQECSDELVPLGPGVRLAYRWRNPSSVKAIRIALAGPTTDWHWSTGVLLKVGTYRVRLEDAEALGSKNNPGGGVYAHVAVDDVGGRRTITIAGRLALANMLRQNMLYKVRARCPDSEQWRTVCSGELEAENIGRTVLCGTDCEMVLKIKLPSSETGWSGDIPLKECPKENVPWLVKVPSEGSSAYLSVWCRVVRARSDGRVLAALWPLYVLHSHLSLDTEMFIYTESVSEQPQSQSQPSMEPTPVSQPAPGRGASTHLLAPGTTSARHTLSFQYKNIESPVTREAVPLHYGVTDTSVFDKRAPVNSVDDVRAELLAWLERSGRHAKSDWPYSLVTKHWPGVWQPAQLQPRSDVTVRYQAVRAGGGCSLELQLCPAALMCNASPLPLTLRAHDAAPLCRLDTGTAVCPPPALLQKPFFISLEMGRETFVSGVLRVSEEDPGRYGALPPGHVALDHAAPFTIHCNLKVALLTMYYEIKHHINILGISPTYELFNYLDVDLLVSAVVVPTETGHDVLLRPKSFKVIPPHSKDSVYGEPLCRFWLHGRWRSNGDPSELRTFLCVALPSGSIPAAAPVPIRLGQPPYRRAVSLINSNKQSVATVVCQVKQDGRWLVSVGADPCPQFVVHNKTRQPLAIAQPLEAAEPSPSYVTAASECDGAKWWCVVPAEAAVHYSSPRHCRRYPPPRDPLPTGLQFLTLGHSRGVTDEIEPNWSTPVAVAEGLQLIQLDGGSTVKLRVRPHPHSTLLQIEDVGQNDISASDIRKRLLQPSATKDNLVEKEKQKARSNSRILERTPADEKLLEKSIAPEDTGEESFDPFETEGSTLLLINRNTPTTSSGERQSTGPSEVRFDTSTEEFEIIKDASRQNSFANDGLTASKTSITSVVTRPQDSIHTVWGDPAKTSASGPDETWGAPSPAQSWASPAGPWAVTEGEQGWAGTERARLVLSAVTVELAASPEVLPLVALHIDRVALLVYSHRKRINTTMSIAGIQIDNLQYESGQFDFGVVAKTAPSEAADEGILGAGGGHSGARGGRDAWPPLWSMLSAQEYFSTRVDHARALVHVQHDSWIEVGKRHTEVTEVEVSLGPLSLFVEDGYARALAELVKQALPAGEGVAGAGAGASAGVGADGGALAELRALQSPLRLRRLLLRPLQLTLTLHTAVRMYIALDQSPLHLGAFKLNNAMTSVERLTHALTVHYLSAAILGAGWVVGGLELLGAPGALAARVGGASGGVRGVASAAAAALVRSLSAWAGSLARNLDLLAGDEEHARRAAAARRRPPPSLVAGLMAGITNFAINILGAVGGLAHHPVVGIAVGESEGGATALRRGLLGALAKPLSATADLVAYAGHGLLCQTGWDPSPQARPSSWVVDGVGRGGPGSWRRDCVRWAFRLAELAPLAGFRVLLDSAPLLLIVTHKFLVVADPESERVVEMIDFKFCSLGPYQGSTVQLSVTQSRISKVMEARAVDYDDEYQLSAAAMARVRQYTGAEGGGGVGGGTSFSAAGAGAGAAAGSGAGAGAGECQGRRLTLVAVQGQGLALHAALAAAVRHNSDAHFSLL